MPVMLEKSTLETKNQLPCCLSSVLIQTFLQNLKQFTLQHTGRILFDVKCAVCDDNSSGKHYGIFACDGCAGFFKVKLEYFLNVCISF